jgi:TfoX N-terminal domain
MGYSRKLAKRVRALLTREAGFTRQDMYGGVVFRLHGNICCGVHGKELIARLGAADDRRALREEHVRRFNLTGRAKQGWLLVGPEATEAAGGLYDWIGRCVAFARALPPKPAPKPKPKRAANSIRKAGKAVPRRARGQARSRY